MKTKPSTDKTRAELIAELEALRASEEAYRLLLDESSDPIVLHSPAGDYLYANREFANSRGTTPEDIIGKTLWDVFPQEESDWRLSVLKRAAETGESQVVELRVPRADGDRYFIATVKPVFDGQRRAISLLCISKEFTEHRRAEMALRESEERIRGFFENIPVGIFICTREGKLIYANPALATIMGFGSSEEMVATVNLTSISAALGADPPQRQAIIAELDRGGDCWLHYEHRYRHMDGRLVEAAISISKKNDVVSGENFLYGILTDITARKQIEAETIASQKAAEKASQAKSRFLAAASHDLKQPIQAIGLFNAALARTGLSEEQKHICEGLTQSVQTLSDFLKELLDISRLDAAVVKPCPEVIHLDTLFNRIDAVLSPLAFDKALRFKFFFPLGEMAIFTDGKLLMSLLGNLIGNAIKYTEQGGVLVGARRRGNQALIQVWDTGIGIAEEQINNIFDEYFQVENLERDGTKGLGLGLSIAKRLASLLETEVVCRSRLGKGSVFEFRLPLAEESPGKDRNS